MLGVVLVLGGWGGLGFLDGFGVEVDIEGG